MGSGQAEFSQGNPRYGLVHIGQKQFPVGGQGVTTMLWSWGAKCVGPAYNHGTQRGHKGPRVAWHISFPSAYTSTGISTSWFQLSRALKPELSNCWWYVKHIQMHGEESSGMHHFSFPGTRVHVQCSVSGGSSVQSP